MRLSSWLRSGRSFFVPSGTEQGHRPTRLPKRFLPTRLSVAQLEDRVVLSTFTVGNLADSGPDSLRAAITAANTNPGADVITFAHGLRGTVALTSGELGITDDLRIDGPGAGRLAVSGSDASRVFNIGSGAAASIDDLTITRGHGLLRGGGILNAGTLTLSDAVVSDNVVVGLPGATPASDAMGGGILNNGTLTVRHTTFVHNQSLGAAGNPGGPGSTGLGGAIMSVGPADAPATTTVSDSTFLDNQAVGGAAGAGAPFTRAGLGGAIMNDNGTMTVSHSLFQDNRAVGGFGGGFPGGFGAGGAIANVSLVGNSVLSVSHSTLTYNQAVGGDAGTGATPQNGRGGGIANFISGSATPGVSATASVDHSTLLGNQAIGGAGTHGRNRPRGRHHERERRRPHRVRLVDRPEPGRRRGGRRQRRRRPGRRRLQRRAEPVRHAEPHAPAQSRRVQPGRRRGERRRHRRARPGRRPLPLSGRGRVRRSADGHLLQRCLHQRPRRVRDPGLSEGVAETSDR